MGLVVVEEDIFEVAEKSRDGCEGVVICCVILAGCKEIVKAVQICFEYVPGLYF